ncbi:cytidylyltransferase domain-containing protein [Maridesulfovibrio hydrothermalis]|uniref:N-acylneuraminate cytidylyltransferase n=1 Tax=Maridesulfovibrio hydrothermalis AM13 = DSM 14728 TaxID=1121451 RepID=L0R9N8_9BACT|nr:acylneuraminate cytidylyltransferase family protein [Maridesulfovibrio hydrothermalis]CCO23459.1 N-acylneuraminate cytidylyltransferase [Maridesulfovibrio hydrothermalis AM13 = DSM 14728]
MEILAIIPARGGSKGIKNKNLLKLCDLSLLGRSISNALKCPEISRILVSTDSSQIAEEGLKYGAEVPFMRPDELSGDKAETIEAVIHALTWLKENENYEPDAVICLQCTSPFVQAKDLRNGIKIFINQKAQAVFSVCEAASHPMKMGSINEQGTWEHLLCSPSETCRQKLDKIYQHNGAFYIVDTGIILTERTWFPDRTLPYIMPQDMSIDLDTERDLKYLEFLMQERSFQELYKS